MRKWIRTKQGSRVQFSIPDHEWLLFTKICYSYGVDPFDPLNIWSDRFALVSSAELRALVRYEITSFVGACINGQQPAPIGFNPDKSRVRYYRKSTDDTAAEAKPTNGDL